MSSSFRGRRSLKYVLKADSSLDSLIPYGHSDGHSDLYRSSSSRCLQRRTTSEKPCTYTPAGLVHLSCQTNARATARQPMLHSVKIRDILTSAITISIIVFLFLLLQYYCYFNQRRLGRRRGRAEPRKSGLGVHEALCRKLGVLSQAVII